MVRTISKARLAQFALLAFAAGEISAAAAEVLVLRSDGPRASRHYRTGTRHADNAVFELRPGDSMVVLAPGGTRTWRGPGYYSLVRPPRPLILANGQQVRVETGVVRSSPAVPGVHPTAVWEYDIAREGKLCVQAGTRPILWRPGSGAAARVTITGAGASHSFDWPAGAINAPWPEALPVTDGGSYLIESTRAQRPVRVTLEVLSPAAESDVDRLATELVGQRCTGQLDTLIATRVDPAAPVLAEPSSLGSQRGR